MSVIGSNILAGASGQAGYFLTKSLRFRSSASAYLNRTPASAGNRQTWTWSSWIKRGTLGTEQRILFANDNGLAHAALMFNSNNTLQLVDYTDPTFDPSGQTWLITTSAVYRDPSAWYHIVAVFDTTNATSSNRMKLYVNGSQITAFSSTNYPTQNYQGYVNNNVLHGIGARIASPLGNYFDGYMAEINMVDGQALTPSSFGETSTTTSVWIPKKYTGTYGTNGFYLKFTDTTSTSTLGTDFSGNSNTWTVNNISLTAGSTYDSMNDVPTLTDITTANYAVFNPINKSTVGSSTPSNGNLNVFLDRSSNNPWIQSTIAFPSSGKWYLEYSQTSIDTSSTPYNMIGVMDVTTPISTEVGSVTGLRGYYLWDGNKRSGTTVSSYGSGTALNDIIGVAVDMDSGKIWFAVNNTWVNSGSPTGGTNAAFTDLTGTTWSFFNSILGQTTSNSWVNFGQRPFSYTPPTGFVRLNTFNLPTPTIGATASTTANKYFNANLYTGNGTTNAITNVGFQPDFVWVKSRSDAYFHGLYDAVRGAGSTKGLYSNDTVAEGTYSDFQNLVSFDSNGFTLGATSNTNNINANTSTFVGWNWRASNATAVTNTAGTITSTVSANTTAGFSIVTWVLGSTDNLTIGHGLGVAPSMIIVKNRSAVAQWLVYQSSNTSAPETEYLALESTQATIDDVRAWNDTLPTSTVFTIGDVSWWGGSTDNMVAYCFAQVAGYSAMGSYTGNGSTDGTFVYLGFRPRYILIKKSSGTEDWAIFDSSRSSYNIQGGDLYADLSIAEGTSQGMDFLSNGVKMRNTGGSWNASGSTYIYYAVAENPFKYSLSR